MNKQLNIYKNIVNLAELGISYTEYNNMSLTEIHNLITAANIISEERKSEVPAGDYSKQEQMTPPPNEFYRQDTTIMDFQT